jgi:N-acetylneuraminate synthase
MKFGEHDIGNFRAPYFIAEIGANHNGRMDLAKQLVDAAKATGCHSAKFQSWSKDSIFSKKVYEDNFFLSDDYRNRTDYTLEQIVEEFSLSFDQLAELKAYCDEVGVVFSSSAFSESEVDFLVDELKVPFLKIASMDLNNIEFLSYVAAKQVPVILSTGLSEMWEIARSVAIFEAAGNTQLSILHCISQYPPKDENINLNNIDMLRDHFPDYPIGFSDHTQGVTVAIAAVAKGACMIEKHFTLDKEMFGWDHKISSDPGEMEALVREATRAHVALGAYRRTVTAADMNTRAAYRRSVVAARDIPTGKVIERQDLDTKRPGTGLSADLLPTIVGRVARRDVAADTLLASDDY